jgi:hypothetical protein
VLKEGKNGLARSLSRQYEGHVVGVMTHAMKGFGVVMNEQRARALSRNHAVKMVEEDAKAQLADAALPFSSRAPIVPGFSP